MELPKETIDKQKLVHIIQGAKYSWLCNESSTLSESEWIANRIYPDIEKLKEEIKTLRYEKEKALRSLSEIEKLKYGQIRYAKALTCILEFDPKKHLFENKKKEAFEILKETIEERDVFMETLLKDKYELESQNKELMEALKEVFQREYLRGNYEIADKIDSQLTNMTTTKKPQ